MQERNNNSTRQVFAIHFCENTEKDFCPLWAFWCFAKTQLLMNIRTWEAATTEDTAHETCNGPAKAAKCTERARFVWSGSHANTVLGHNHKEIKNLAVVTFKCNLYSAGGRFFGTYFKKLLDMMSISTLLEPLNILSGNPASESLLLWRYTDLLEGEKKMI